MKEYMKLVAKTQQCVDRLNEQGGEWTPHKVELAVWTHSSPYTLGATEGLVGCAQVPWELDFIVIRHRYRALDSWPVVFIDFIFIISPIQEPSSLKILHISPLKFTLDKLCNMC